MFKQKVPAIIAQQEGGPRSAPAARKPARLELFEHELAAVIGGLGARAGVLSGGPLGCTETTSCTVNPNQFGHPLLDDVKG